mmetsp:Transcript_57236/g.63936  ORF Transcript_57236/g.63936 Transcript_57236/m.63936 type:complete len:942 (-) Transcript_57236:401-3226(-)
MLRFLRRRVSSDGESSCASSEHTHNLQPKDCNSISNNDNDPATPVSAKETRTSKSNCVPSTPISVTKTREMHSMRLKEVVTKTLLNKVEGLKTFETCIDTSDVLASTSTSSGNPVDNATGLVDCSVLVSADGELLIIPQQQLGKEEQEKQRRDFGKNQSNESEAEEAIDRAELGEEYNSAVFLGNDLHYHGDKRINGFSSKGWSTPAASLALKQSADAMGCLAEFVEDLVLTKKSGAAQENQMADKMHRIIGMKTSVLDESKVVDYQQYMQDNFSPEVNQWEKKRYNIRNKFRSQHQQLKPRTQSVILDKIVTPDRVGPLNRPGGTIPATLVALENYYSSNAESESKLWRAVTQQQGALTKLRNSTIKTEERVRNRQLASQETMRRIKVMEDYLRECKEHAMKKWDEVHVTEKKITQLLEERMMEQSRIREKERLETIKHDQVKLEKSALYENPGPTSSEILDIVSAATASMEEGSFELIDLPHSPLSISANEDAKLACVTPKTNEIPSDLLSDSRYEIEVELSLPELRLAALAAEEAVEDAANSLLSVLSNWDTTNRSAHVATDTCLLSAVNAQASCLRSIITIERESIKERLKLLEELEIVANNVDVRKDVNEYITIDKTKPGGRSFLGDDDDGGVASALNRLHGDVEMGQENTSDNEEKYDVNDSSITPECIEESLECLFRNEPLFLSDAPINDNTKKAQEELEISLVRLCSTGENKSPRSKTRRSIICYAMNAKRSSHAKILSSAQFEGICKVFSAVFSGCGTNDSDLSSAVLMMSLSKHFYTKDSNQKKIYVKNHLTNHPIWDEDNFWDRALHLTVTEKLNYSGVMSNFARDSTNIVTNTKKERSEWTETYQMRWHDLTEKERYEAASQVHFVVFTQISEMADSMLEFCGSVEKTSAFVRRMCVRNSLPVSQRTTLLRHLIGLGGDEITTIDKSKT